MTISENTTALDVWGRYGCSTESEARELAQAALSDAHRVLSVVLPLVMRSASPAAIAGLDLAESFERSTDAAWDEYHAAFTAAHGYPSEQRPYDFGPDSDYVRRLYEEVRDMLALVGVTAGKAGGWTECFITDGHHGRILGEFDPDGPHEWRTTT